MHYAIFKYYNMYNVKSFTIFSFGRPALQNPQTRYNTDALRDVLQPWVQKLEQTYRSCKSEGIVPWSKGHHLPVTVREDVGRLATLCFSLDIYANEEGHGNGEGEMEQEPQSKFETGIGYVHTIILF